MYLSIEEVGELVTQKCHYCGSMPSNRIRSHGKRTGFFYQGIDRKDNEKGYSVDNVVPCCHPCNRLKSDILTHQEMVAVALALGAFRRLLALQGLAPVLQAHLHSIRGDSK